MVAGTVLRASPFVEVVANCCRRTLLHHSEGGRMRELLLSGTILTAFLGGVVALLAPCCVSVMLPAYFSATFARRSRILAMTLVFAIGVGTVILPIGLGASAISRLLAGQHFAVFAVMGVLLAAGGAAMIAGGTVMLPMPGMGGADRVWPVSMCSACFPGRPARAVPPYWPVSRWCRGRPRRFRRRWRWAWRMCSGWWPR